MIKDLYWHGYSRDEVLVFAKENIPNWLAGISNEQFDDFAIWARSGGAYSPDEDRTWDAFRGYCKGLRNNSKAQEALDLLRECREALVFYDNDHTTKTVQKLDKFLGGE